MITIPEFVDCSLLVYILSINVAELDANRVGSARTGEKPKVNTDSRYSFVFVCVSDLSRSMFMSPMIILCLRSVFIMFIMSCKLYM